MRERRHTAKPEPPPAIDPEGRLHRIEGRHHRLVKNLRQAIAKEDVSPEGYFGIEGLHLVEEAIRSGLKLGTVFFSTSAQRKAERLLPQIGPHTETVVLDDRLFASAVRTERPQGVAALVRARIFRLEDVLERSQVGPIVVITGLQDPGNLGTIIRSAEAFEAAGVLLGEGTVSPLNAKAVRAAAGSLFRQPVVRVKIEEVLGQLRDRGIRRLATAAHKGTPLPQAAMTGPFAIFLGGEGAGLGPDLMRNLEEVVTIPHADRVESLNAGVAGSLLLYEAWRQRKATCRVGSANEGHAILGSKDADMGLFQSPSPAEPANDPTRPLADRMRPRSLDEFVGQDHLIGPGKPLRTQIERDDLGSLIFWGPPGTGKTTLAKIIARMSRAEFIEFSAVLSGIKEIKQVMSDAERARQYGTRTIVFIDEIHRFNKAQQDAFLPHVEKGNIRLIGATTENPSFEIISALLSRSRVYVLKPLTEEQIVALLRRALAEERGLAALRLTASEAALSKIAAYSSGDARSAYNVLEVAATLARAGRGAEAGGEITAEMVEEAVQKRVLLYDKAGEEHFNLISALHKSVRNSDVDASLYWLGRMLESGEDPLYIARRLVRMAVEDIGLADPNALSLTMAARDAVDFIGMPEGNLALAEAAAYLSLAPKSNALYRAYAEVVEDVERTAAAPVPLHLRNAPTGLMKGLGYGHGYQYAHDFERKITDMQCLPDNLRDRVYYHPTSEGMEKRLQERRQEIARTRAQRKGSDEGEGSSSDSDLR